MSQDAQEILKLVCNPRYKYAVGELAAALLIATNALREVGGKQTVFARLSNSGSVANTALENVRALLGDRMDCLDDLAAEFFQLRQAVRTVVPESSSTGGQP